MKPVARCLDHVAGRVRVHSAATERHQARCQGRIGKVLVAPACPVPAAPVDARFGTCLRGRAGWEPIVDAARCWQERDGLIASEAISERSAVMSKYCL